MNERILIAALTIVIVPTVASAQEKKEVAAPVEAPIQNKEPATAFHIPTPKADGGHDTPIYVVLHNDWKYEHVTLEYRRLDSPGAAYVAVPFERSSSSDWVAVVPGGDMQPPGVEYYIHGRSDGAVLASFASEQQPHRVVVLGETDYTREQERLARHHGNRSEFGMYGEYTRYGTRAYDLSGAQAAIETNPGTDWNWAGSLQYTYRFLSRLYAINFGIGVMRGHQATVDLEDGTQRADPIAGLDGGEPGMNYGWGQLTLEANRLLSFDARLLLGASAVGFAAGVGGTLRVGEISGTRLEIGGEAFQDIGSVGSMFFHWDTIPRVPMALGIELTNRPNPDAPGGSRVILDVGFEITEAIGVTARMGNVIRTSGTAAGWMGGLQTTYAF